MQIRELDTYKLWLVSLRKRLTRDVEMAEEALRDDVASPGELSTLHTHAADQAAEGVDEQIAIAQNEEHLLEQVEAALERIEQGTYGTCQNCGRVIARERLDAIPYTPLCIECARRQAGKAR
jgi:DnaK suppressor protein